MQNIKHKLRALAALLIIAALLLPLTVSCGKVPAEDDGKLTVVCTTFPIYDWTRSVVGDSETVNVELLVSSGTDLHSFQPSVADIAKISNAELLIHIGGASDIWVQDAADQAEDLRVLTLSEADGITLLSLSGDEHHHSHEESDHSHGDFDEHIWLSLNNAMVCSRIIAATISELDKTNTEKYNDNLNKYLLSNVASNVLTFYGF
jgi:zinc transport system substrate-binding protein